MIKKIIFQFTRFNPITTVPQLKNSKIKHNQLIQNSQDRNALLQFYSNYSQLLNMINIVSYVRKYTDYMIQQNEVDNHTDILHTFNVLNGLKQMIINGEYKKFGDKEHDHVRSFIMLLSLSVELLQRTQSDNNRNQFHEFAKLAKQQIYEQNLLYQCNIDEISVYLRCITQIKELNPTEEEELKYWKLLNHQKFTPHQSCKLLHSLSKFQTINEKTIENLLKTLETINNQINQKDAISLFFSFKHLYEKTTKFQEIILELFNILQDHMIREQYKLSIKNIGVIYNALALIPFQPNQSFLNYLEYQLLQQNQLTLLCLAHYYQFQETYPEINKAVQNKVIKYLKQITITTVQQAEQFTMLFYKLCHHCTPELIDLFSPHFREMPINDFILGKLFSAFLKLKLNNEILYEIHQVCIQRLKNYEQTINIHALNSIYRAQFIQNSKYQSFFIEFVNKQINQNSKQILFDNFQRYIVQKQYYELFEDLQVLCDFLKIYQNNDIKQNIQNLIEELIIIKDAMIVGKIQNFIDQLKQFIDRQ